MALIGLGYLFLLGRIVLLGAERIILKFLDNYDSTIVAALFFTAGGVFLIPVLFFLRPDEFFLSLQIWWYIALASAIYSIGFFLYVKALSITDASLIAPLYNSSLLWLMILGLIFLGEHVSIYRVFGAVTMFIGVFFLYSGNFRDRLIEIWHSRGSMYMIIGSIFVAFGRTIDTHIIHQINATYYAIISNFGIGAFLFFAALLQKKLSLTTQVLREKSKTVALAGIVNGWSYLMLLIAILYLEVTVAEPASLLSIFVTALLAKYILHEEVAKRILGMILMVIGAVVLILS